MKWHYLYIFVQSNLLEIAVFYLFYRGTFSFKKTAAVATCANLITHPIVFFGFLSSGLSILNATLIAELFAPVTEGFLHKYSLKMKPLYYFMLSSLAANLFSWQFGPVLTYLIFWK